MTTLLIFVIVSCIIGLAILEGISVIHKEASPIVGTLTINHSDPSEDLLSFTFEKDLDEIEDSEAVAFLVKINRKA